MEISIMNKFSKEFYLNTDTASILSTNNIGSNPKSQLPIDNRLENKVYQYHHKKSINKKSRD